MTKAFEKQTAAFSAVLLFCCFAFSAFAQVMPPPHSAPRTPVNRQPLPESKPAQVRDVQGQALVIDGEKLRIGDVEVRLFGIVPPQLSANFGPQARASLDNLVQGQVVSCHVRDRDHDGRLLATCRNPNGADLALEQLKHGLAVTARGSLTGTELLQAYLAAEEAAQNQKIGLWSVSVPSAVASTGPEQTKPAPVIIQPETKKEPEAKKEPETVKNQTVLTPPVIAPATTSMTQAFNPPVIVEGSKDTEVGGPDLFARYQILIAGVLMLATALSIIGVFSTQRRRERREEMKAIGAALRGELLGARAVCQTRLRSITNDDEDRMATWPRLRSTLYQAYVGRIGWLGAGLARQVASIYGQAADYAAYFNNAVDENAAATSKRQALQLLLNHIDEVLPRLEIIEKSGHVPQMTASKHIAAPQWGPPKTPPVPPAASTVSNASVKPPVTEIAAYKIQAAITALWDIMCNFAREHIPERRAATGEPADYTTIIEQEMANMSFTEGEEELLRSPSVGGAKNQETAR